jgi:hypothetical protein
MATAKQGGIAALAILFILSGCGGAGRALPPPLAFKVEADPGCILAVSVYSYGMHLSDAELGRLVKKGMERQLGRELKGAPELTCPDQAPVFVAWRVRNQGGRPSKTFVGVEFSRDGGKPSFAFLLIAGPDEPLIKSALIAAVNVLTRRISNGLGLQPGAVSDTVSLVN